jgi:Predicted nucleotide-binding protein containing TIR-like domain
MGSQWRREIEDAIFRASAAVLLISPNFMASEFIATNELPHMLSAARQKGLIVLPVIVRKSRFERDTILTEFQSVNSPSQPLIDMQTGKRDVVFEKLAQTIEDQVKSHGSINSESADSEHSTIASAQISGSGKHLVPRPRIFISSVGEMFLSPYQLQVKQRIVAAISQAGFEPQEFMKSGLPAKMIWNLEAANETIKNCQGAAVIAFPRWRAQTEIETSAITSEIVQIEAALASSHSLPIFVSAEEGLVYRGAISLSEKYYVVQIPRAADQTWIDSDCFRLPFEYWRQQIQSRPHVFLAYTASASPMASEVREYLRSVGLSVLDSGMDFDPGESLAEAIDKAAAVCLSAIFVIAARNNVKNRSLSADQARENLIFCAGYFARARGFERALILCDGDAVPLPDIVPSVLIRDTTDRDRVRSAVHTFAVVTLSAVPSKPPRLNRQCEASIIPPMA